MISRWSQELTLSAWHHSLVVTLESIGLCIPCVGRHLGIYRAAEIRTLYNTLGYSPTVPAHPRWVEQKPQPHLELSSSSSPRPEIAATSVSAAPDETTPVTQALTTDASSAQLDSVTHTTKPPKAVCPACLGMLHQDYNTYATQVWSAIQAGGYVGQTSFTMRQRLPVELTVRQRSVELALQHAFPQPEGPFPPIIDPKEYVRVIATPFIERVSGYRYDKASPFSMEWVWTHAPTAEGWRFLTKIPQVILRTPKPKARRGGVFVPALHQLGEACEASTYADFVTHAYCPPPIPDEPAVLANVLMKQESLFVAGRYCKIARGISNSPWLLGKHRLSPESVEEWAGDPISAYLGSAERRFCSAGREDADVLCLGQGRPFYIEFLNPKKAVVTVEELQTLQATINAAARGKVQVRDLQPVTQQATRVLKDSASTKSKSYRCTIRLVPALPATTEKKNLIASIAGMMPLAVAQGNPTRTPRRADLVRHKMIESILIKYTPTAANEIDILVVDLTTSAGTYVKEFMHSDSGRTEPSIKSLLSRDAVEVVSLDVLAVHLDWPVSLNKDLPEALPCPENDLYIPTKEERAAKVAADKAARLAKEEALTVVAAAAAAGAATPVADFVKTLAVTTNASAPSAAEDTPIPSGSLKPMASECKRLKADD